MVEKQECIVVNRINFDQRDLRAKQKDYFRFYKSKEKYRFNDIKIDLNSLFIAEKIKKSPVVRIQVALRDNFGVVYDTMYSTMSDN